MKTSSIAFQVETNRVLEIISDQIYDSPYAMVRENIQNSYDAILMRGKLEGKPLSDYKIEVIQDGRIIRIIDDGIGMSEAVLKENFWKAGSSGKNSDAARAAGVIGTFGIGAMANFGVCSKLSVITRGADEPHGFRTVANKSELRIGEDCITFDILDEDIPVGTNLTADIEDGIEINTTELKKYVLQFVQFLPVPVYINNELISQHSLTTITGIDAWSLLGEDNINAGDWKFKMEVFTSGNQVGAICSEFSNRDHPIQGRLCLRSGYGSLMGLRSSFGLAPLPVATVYQLGGFADLPFLIPTAGREALTRDSIQQASQLFPSIERGMSYIISKHPQADTLSAFQQYILNSNQTALAGRVKIQIQDREDQVELGELKSAYPDIPLQWYEGNDPELIKQYGSSDIPLLRVSQSHPRREVQTRYLRKILQIPSIPDTVTILAEYELNELSRDEVSLTIMLGKVLHNDYLLNDTDIRWTKFSHGVNIKCEMAGETLIIKISRTWPAVVAILKHMDTSFHMLETFTKDLVRSHIYQHIQHYVPTSQRMGLDALKKLHEKKRELYRLDQEDNGDLEPLIADYLTGKLEIGKVLSAAIQASSAQNQHVTAQQAGTVEKTLASIINTPVVPRSSNHSHAPQPGSPILQLDTHIHERLLTTDQSIPQLNNYKMFLSLSDRVFDKELEIFKWPHSTQVAWAGWRIVYLFTVANSGISLYYDIELKGGRSAGDAGGQALTTTTIVSDNRIMIPVPDGLMNCFRVNEKPVEFYVRFDVLSEPVQYNAFSETLTS
ncbi:ATP-binding protein [Pseudomonas putida]|uniref:ATP-binding protein n=1 Tax=Pseudomonas putida TaxID=303 RepID=UPI0023632453|nr:ATP-binding protein [Pseudomonas putida]MDD1963754.1 ATP-binding protein [Pseudomonas putida]